MPTAHDSLPIWIQKGESVVVALLAVLAFVEAGYEWWWLLALFLVFDLSMVGYAVDPAVGAWGYNAVHSYVGPALLGVAAVATGETWPAFLGLVWAFHVAVDRALGYGLKFRDRFTHTHLGEVGRTRR